MHVCVTFLSCFSFREGLKKIPLKNLVSFLCEKEIEDLYHIQIVKLKRKTHIFGRGQTWHRPEDVEAALDNSLKNLGLDYGNVKTPCFKEVGTTHKEAGYLVVRA